VVRHTGSQICLLLPAVEQSFDLGVAGLCATYSARLPTKEHILKSVKYCHAIAIVTQKDVCCGSSFPLFPSNGYEVLQLLMPDPQ